MWGIWHSFTRGGCIKKAANVISFFAVRNGARHSWADIRTLLTRSWPSHFFSFLYSRRCLSSTVLLMLLERHLCSSPFLTLGRRVDWSSRQHLKDIFIPLAIIGRKGWRGGGGKPSRFLLLDASIVYAWIINTHTHTHQKPGQVSPSPFFFKLLFAFG